MGSSTTDIRQPINERQRERILELVFQLNKFTLQEIIDESGIHP